MLGYKSKRDFILTYRIVLAFAITGFVIRYFKIYKEVDLWWQVVLFVLSLVVMASFWESLRLTHLWLNRAFPFERNITLRILIQMSLGAVIGIFFRFIVFLVAEPLLPFKLDALFVIATWAMYIMLTIGVNLGFFTAYLLELWKATIVKAERLEKEKSQVQFDNLKNQLNPHFLFNALTSLNSLIFEDQKLASEFLQQLSKVYRYLLQNKDKNFVSLKTELEFIQHYVSLLETRFHGAVKIDFQISDEAEERAIVPVTLQILIENALKHNVADTSKPLGIDIVSVGDYLVVSNNLQARNTVATSNKQGLENLKSLYRFLTPRPILVEPSTDRFNVKIPLL